MSGPSRRTVDARALTPRRHPVIYTDLTLRRITPGCNLQGKIPVIGPSPIAYRLYRNSLSVQLSI